MNQRQHLWNVFDEFRCKIYGNSDSLCYVFVQTQNINKNS